MSDMADYPDNSDMDLELCVGLATLVEPGDGLLGLAPRALAYDV